MAPFQNLIHNLGLILGFIFLRLQTKRKSFDKGKCINSANADFRKWPKKKVFSPTPWFIINGTVQKTDLSADADVLAK